MGILDGSNGGTNWSDVISNSYGAPTLDSAQPATNWSNEIANEYGVGSSSTPQGGVDFSGAYDFLSSQIGNGFTSAGATDFPVGGVDFSGLDTNTSSILSGTSGVLKSLYGSVFGEGKNDLLGGSQTDKARTEDPGNSKGMVQRLWETISDDKNKVGTNLAANFIAGMFAQNMKNAQINAMNANARAAEMNAQTNAGELALQQQKLANGSAIANTNFGTAPTANGLIYSDKLATRRARSGA